MSKWKFDREMEKLLLQHRRNVEYLNQHLDETDAGPSDNNNIPLSVSDHINFPISISSHSLENLQEIAAGPSDHNNIPDSPENLEMDDDSFPNQSLEELEYYDEEFDEEVDGRSDFVVGIAKWISESNVSRDNCNSLLKFLNENGHADIPRDICTLMKTPLQKIHLRPVTPGLYYHFGIQNHFNDKDYSFLSAPCNKVEIDIGIDGAKIFTSSKITIWPIMGAFVDRPNVKPFLIGCYTGKAQPNCPNDFLKDFCDEILLLRSTGGITVKNNHEKVPLTIRCFSCDAPARAFLSGIMYHNATHGCPKCDAIGEYSPKSIVRGNPRTDQTFLSRLHPNHHHKEFLSTKTALEEIGIQMVSQMPLDPMHLCDLGVTKKCIQLLIDKTVSNVKVQEISRLLEEVIKPNTPIEFERTCRSLDEIALWKATEFRQYLLYSSIVLLKDTVDGNVYYHWLLLFCGMRLLSSTWSVQNSVTANRLFEEFVKHYPAIYGFLNVVYNVHGLLHLAEDVQRYGSLDSYSCYKFENFIQILKKPIKKPGQVLQQIFRRHYEYEQIPHDNKKPLFGQMFLSSRPKDNFCLITDPKKNNSFPIKLLENRENKIITGVRCLNLSPFFIEPLNSADALGIIQYSSVSDQIELFDYSNVAYKYFRIPHHENAVLIPILHQIFSKFSNNI